LSAYNRDMFWYEDDVDAIRELLAVKHGDLELDVFSSSVLDAFVEFYVLNNFYVCLFLSTFLRFS